MLGSQRCCCHLVAPSDDDATNLDHGKLPVASSGDDATDSEPKNFTCMHHVIFTSDSEPKNDFWLYIYMFFISLTAGTVIGS